MTIATAQTIPIRPTLVASPDGTQIAVFVSGAGRPLVLVPGTTSDHTTWRLVVPLLEPNVEVNAVDRRGRGASGDGPAYALEREVEDLAAVVDATAARWGGPVDLLGHSYGGNVAFGAALRTSNLRRLVLYEGWPVPDVADRTMAPDILAHLDDLLAHGRRAEALEAFFREMVQVTEEEIANIKASPAWSARVAAAPTVPRELRAFGEQAFDPASAARIDVPVLLLVGSESPDEILADPEVVAAAFPDARIGVLNGQAHMAQLTAPEALAAAVLDFLSD
ncbi:alpha/beta fold hydrolase [Agromyces sp. NPDC058484]|uniref:alpha/beta fold hydrolase n=1 Tax=Agromyces sp. NPDC058484 TaxID=3346524 RepID=UPI00365B2A32